MVRNSNTIKLINEPTFFKDILFGHLTIFKVKHVDRDALTPYQDAGFKELKVPSPSGKGMHHRLVGYNTKHADQDQK